jgi:4-amino-4-deoxy-L-arabinose transferase-like glycosyltransferase
MNRPGAAKGAVLLVLIASLRIVSTYKTLSHTTDEPAHLAAGMEWLEGGRYTYENQHPPLARVLGAIGLHLAGSRWSHGPEMYFEGYHLLGYNHRYAHNLFYARLAMLPLFWIASLVVFLWTSRIAGGAAAFVATLLFTTTPAVLGHAGLATTDMAVTAFTGAAVLSALYWADRPNWKRSI